MTWMEWEISRIKANQELWNDVDKICSGRSIDNTTSSASYAVICMWKWWNLQQPGVMRNAMYQELVDKRLLQTAHAQSSVDCRHYQRDNRGVMAVSCDAARAGPEVKKSAKRTSFEETKHTICNSVCSFSACFKKKSIIS